jgi:hypothetical protein
MENVMLKFVSVVGVLVLLVACDKKDNNAPTTSGSVTTSASAPAAIAKGGGCVEGAYKDPNGIYCVKVPEGYKPPKSTRKSGDNSIDQFESSDGFNFISKYWTPNSSNGTFDQMKGMAASESDTLKKVTPRTSTMEMASMRNDTTPRPR